MQTLENGICGKLIPGEIDIKFDITCIEWHVYANFGKWHMWQIKTRGKLYKTRYNMYRVTCICKLWKMAYVAN